MEFLFQPKGSKDQVHCFFCGGGFKDWEEDVDPWIEHARWFPSCSFVKQCKGGKFIQKVQAKEQGREVSLVLLTMAIKLKYYSMLFEKRKFNRVFFYQTLKEEHYNSAAFQSVMEMGFSKEEIRKVYEKSLYKGK